MVSLRHHYLQLKIFDLENFFIVPHPLINEKSYARSFVFANAHPSVIDREEYKKYLFLLLTTIWKYQTFYSKQNDSVLNSSAITALQLLSFP